MTPYLSPAEYAAYGISDAAAGQVARATRLVDAYLGRPEGLLYSLDAGGLPAWHTNATPTSTFTLTADTVIGDATIPGLPEFPSGTVGIIGRGGMAEAVISAGSSVISPLKYPHAAGSMIEYGLVSEITVAYSPQGYANRSIARVHSAAGWSYGYYADRYSPWELLTDYCFAGGRLVCDSPRHSSLRLSVVIGYAAAPEAVKHAVASVVRNQIDAGIPGNIKMLKAGDSTIERFAAGGFANLDSEAMALLAPFRTYRI